LNSSGTLAFVFAETSKSSAFIRVAHATASLVGTARCCSRSHLRPATKTRTPGTSLTTSECLHRLHNGHNECAFVRDTYISLSTR
jgi:hypothetical protein